MDLKQTWKNTQSRYLIILIVLIIATGFGLTDKVYNTVVYSPMKNYCENYLDTATLQSNNLFMSLSLAKGAVAVIDGSSVNVSFIAGMEVEVGDVVQPVYDAIDIAWDASLMSVISLQIQRLFFELFQMQLLRYLLLACLLLYLVYVLFSRTHTSVSLFFWKMARYVLLLATCIYLIFPLGVVGTSAIATYLDINHKRPAYAQLEKEFEKLHTFSSLVENLDDKKEPSNAPWYDVQALSSKMGGQWDAFKVAITTLPAQLKASSGLIFTSVSKIVTIYILEVIILPILFLLVFWSLIKSVVGGARVGRKANSVPLIKSKLLKL